MLNIQENVWSVRICTLLMEFIKLEKFIYSVFTTAMDILEQKRLQPVSATI